MNVGNKRCIVAVPLASSLLNMQSNHRNFYSMRMFSGLLAIAVLAACASTGPAPLRDVAPVAVDVTVPPKAVEQVVLDALDKQNWQIVRPFDRGIAVAERPYGAGKARIRARVARGVVHLEYISSDKLDYAIKNDVAVIDDRYNGWMDLLRSEIEFGVLTLDAARRR